MNHLNEMKMADPLYIVKCNLDYSITIEEVSDVVHLAKNGKSAGSDHIPNEVLKCEMLIPVLHTLFNLCYDYGITPNNWSEAIIAPILKVKSTDKRIPMNYRGISLLSCMSKLYGNILNKRIVKFLDSHSLIVDEQNGFRKKALLYRSCICIE